MPNAQLQRLATAQAGVVTTTQALGLGTSRHTLARLAAEDTWRRLAPGLYLTAATAPDWHALAWGGVLLGGPEARLGGTSAAYAGRLIDDAPLPVLVLVPHGSPARSRGEWTFVHERPGVRSPRCTGTPPRLLVPDTVLDLCDQSEAEAAVDWVLTSLQRRLTTPTSLRRALERRSRARYRTLLVELLADADQGAESPLEIRFLRDVERAHGLPRARRQAPVLDRPGWRDVLYEEFGLVIELDGRRGHEGSGRFRDMRRDNAALRQRLLTLRYGWGDVFGRPCHVALEVAELLVSLGWGGTFVPCPACPPGLVRM